MALLQGIKKLLNNRLPDSPIRGVDDSLTHQVGESTFDYEYLHEFEAKIETARKLVWGTYTDLNYANYAGHCFSCFSSSGTTCISFKNSIADSPTHRVGESNFDYVYLHQFEAKIKTARKLVWGTYTYADLNYAKTSENSVLCHCSTRYTGSLSCLGTSGTP